MEENETSIGIADIQHEEKESGGTFFLERDGDRVAEAVYRRAEPNIIVLEHTEVDDTLSGQGVGSVLIEASVAWAREMGARIRPVCPYARSRFVKDPSLRDVLVEPIG